ncbi:MAG: hypothetical protein HYX24_04265 [Candidatus Aenigmarchaeota archaeon]|nr:hypothetical protein [Candidatus Aenigmarchaeota archaeon]
MAIGKGVYLKKLTSRTGRFRSVEVGERLEGTSPPSVFIGRSGYPKVYAGPMLTPSHGDTSGLDTPEGWLDNRFLQTIVNFRLQLVRGKSLVSIKDLDSRFVSQLQEIAIAKQSPETEAEFKSRPRGVTFNMDHSPFGPSAPIKSLDFSNVKWEYQLEKVYYDADLKAAEAVVDLYNKNLLFSQIQKAFSVGTMGLGKNRKLVPTRWSITAVDDTLAGYLLKKVKEYEMIDTYQAYQFQAMKNNFVILLLPTYWQYEWMETFLHVMGSEELLFSDWEPYTGKTGYSSVGGCFYSVKFAVLEALERMQKQAGVVVFREAYRGYIPTGVWLCREETRKAMQSKPAGFSNLMAALEYISSRLALPMERYRAESRLLRHMRQQTRIASFV